MQVRKQKLEEGEKDFKTAIMTIFRKFKKIIKIKYLKMKTTMSEIKNIGCNYGHTRPPDPPPEKPGCRSGSNS